MACITLNDFIGEQRFDLKQIGDIKWHWFDNFLN